MRRGLVWASASLGLLGLWVAPVSAAPQTFNTALPVAEGEFVFREQLLWLEATGDPSPADRELNVLGAVSVLGYGVTGNLAVFGMLPYLAERPLPERGNHKQLPALFFDTMKRATDKENNPLARQTKVTFVPGSGS